ncbi:hypothetical protein CRG98_029282 [Punica granatum]|uniref:G-patch domain-containing protein n=1 Tax=Punica granatum TaxID=22663 RepID=A0A2I0J263_PUNGR|nr:hypothetical protein CRG98_029282 [Punica granatum]
MGVVSSRVSVWKRGYESRRVVGNCVGSQLSQRTGIKGDPPTNRVLMAAQIPKETAPERIEKTISSIFFNNISFSDDELPSEGLLLGRPWIHAAGVVPSSLQQMIKFIAEDRLITVKGEKDYAIYKETVVPYVLLRNNYILDTRLGAHGQGISRPIEIEEYKNKRELGFRPSCHEIIEARRGMHLHCLAARYGKINRGIPVHPLSYFFPGPPHIVGGTLDGPSSDSDSEPVDLPTICAVTEETTPGAYIHLT